MLESGDGWCRPSSSCPNSVIRARLPPQGVCSSATSVFVVSSSPATEAPFCSAERHDAQRVDDAHLDHVAVATLEGVEAVVDTQLGDLGDDLVPGVAGVRGDQVRRLGERAAHDLHADRVVVLDVQLVERRRGVHQRDAAAGDDALGHRGPGGRQRVLDAVLQLGQLGVGRRTDPDHGHLARQRPDPLGEHVLVDAERRPLQLGAQLGEPELDLVGGSCAADDRRPLGGDPDLGRPAELLQGHRLQA